MRLLARLSVLCALAFAATFGGALLAQQKDVLTAEERREIVRRLPRDDQSRLRAALERFRGLPAERQAALRAKADAVGQERLRHLAGRDIGSLKGRHDQLAAEVDAVFANIGPERLALLNPAERAYLRAEALRGFQRHVKRRVLSFGNYVMMDSEWERMTPAERKSRIDAGMRALEESALSRVPSAEADRIRSLPPKERRAARAETFAKFRLDETLDFAKQFNRYRIEEHLRQPPAEREKRVTKWQQRSQWFEAARVLRTEVGLDEATLRQLAPLPADAWARVLFEVRQTEDLAPDLRRARIAELIGKMAGDAAISASAPPKPLGRLLRERRAARER